MLDSLGIGATGLLLSIACCTMNEKKFAACWGSMRAWGVIRLPLFILFDGVMLLSPSGMFYITGPRGVPVAI